MTSPLSKIAKGVQNIGMNLDPRKIATKVSWSKTFNATFLYCICVYYFQTGALTPSSASAENSPPERGVSSKAQLEEMWQEGNCKTKLIAL